jgi:hypothetical protein
MAGKSFESYKIRTLEVLYKGPTANFASEGLDASQSIHIKPSDKRSELRRTFAYFSTSPFGRVQ